MKFNNKKKIILGSIITLILIISLGVTYAFFTFGKNSLNSQLVAGDIYIQYKETNSINIPDMMPRSTYVDNENGYFEFQITGKNTYTEKDIIYDVVLSYGDNPIDTNRTIRIKDELLRFRLVKVVNNEEQEIFNNRSYTSINNKRIHKETIPAETNTETTTTYRIYAWISEETKIGNANDADYSLSDWNKVFASIKVNVTGDFEEKKVPEPLYDIVKTGATSDSGIHFYEINGTDNGNGKFVRNTTTSDAYPIYYYRGNVDNNNVIFANKCWKIVRTTETGGTKMIYNGAATTIVDGEKQCNQTTGTGTQLSVGTKVFNSRYKSPAYVGYSLPESSKRYSYSTQSLNSTTYYGSSVDQATKRLVDPVLELNDTHHYSYNSTDPDATGISGDTGNVRYYYYKSSASGTSGTGYFIKFDKTKSVSTILDEMLTESNSKNNPSNIQGVINTWWGTGDNSLNSKYGEYLEDTEWCNDRSIASYGGWSPTGTLYSSSWKDYYLIFNERVRYDQSTFGSDANNIRNTNTPILTCSNPNDRLSVANGNLTYPIGLLTYDEVAMAGARWSNGNSNFYLYTNKSYWLLSPSYFISYDDAFVGYVSSSGNLGSTVVNLSGVGVRPSLSLKHGTQILRGEGTKTKPYIITED